MPCKIVQCRCWLFSVHWSEQWDVQFKMLLLVVYENLSVWSQFSSSLWVGIVLPTEGRRKEPPFPAYKSPLDRDLYARSPGAQAFRFRLTPGFPGPLACWCRWRGLLRHKCTSQFSVLSPVFGFIFVENIDKYSLLEKTEIVVGVLRGGREQKKGKLGSLLWNIPVLCFNLVFFFFLIWNTWSL